MVTAHDPLRGIDRLLVDGTNLLHALRRGPEPAPAATLVGRLRALIPPGVRIEIVFDGPPDPGSGNVRVASGVTVRYSGRQSADALLAQLVGDAAPRAIEAAATTLVVTDDHDLARELRRRGAITARTAWLLHRLERASLAAPSAGRAHAPRPAGGAGAVRAGSPTSAPVAGTSAPGDGDEPEARRWQPGRGATTKHGNPRRRARRVRPGAGR